MSDDLHVSQRVTIPARDLSWTAARSGGPGGQNVNKVATKVDLRFDLENTEALSPQQKHRLGDIPSIKLDADGRVMLTCDETRDQHRNLQLARQRLAALIKGILTPPKRRRKTKPTRGSVRRRLDDKKQNSQKKKGRKKIRKVDY